jgi:signal transduction histidine kinase
LANKAERNFSRRASETVWFNAEHLPHLFDSFFTTKETGMGLSLPIARSIIEVHNRAIRADNNSALGGARLIIEPPAAPSTSL